MSKLEWQLSRVSTDKPLEMTTDNTFCSCLLCRKPFENIWTHSVAHYRKVYSSSVKYLSDEVKGNYFHWNHTDLTLHPPFCTVCFKNAEKLFEIDEQLVEIQRRLSDYLTVFNLEIVNARNELIIGPCDTSNDLESFHARLLKAPNEISFIENIYTSGLEDLTSQILNSKNDIFVVENNEIKSGSLHAHNQIKTLENFGVDIPVVSNPGCLNVQNGNPGTIVNNFANKNSALEIFNSEVLNGLDITSQSKPCTSAVATQKKKKSPRENTLGNQAGCYKLLDVQPLDPGNIYASKTFGLENYDGFQNQKNVQNLVVESPSEAKTVETRNANENVVYYVVRKEHLVFARPPDDYSESEVAAFDDYVADWSGDEESRETETLIRDLKVHKLEDDLEECIKQPSITQRSLPREGAISAANLYSVFLDGNNRCENETDGAQTVVLPNCESNEAEKKAKCANIGEQSQKRNGMGKGSRSSKPKGSVVENVAVLPLRVEEVIICTPPLEDIASIVTLPVEEIITAKSNIENNIIGNDVSPSLENCKLVSPIAKLINVSPVEVVHVEISSLNHVKDVTRFADNVKVAIPSVGTKTQVDTQIIGKANVANSPVEKANVANYLVEKANVANSPVENSNVNFSVIEAKVVKSSVIEPKAVNSSVDEPKIVDPLIDKTKGVDSSAKKSKVATIPIRINVMIPPLKFKTATSPIPKIVNVAAPMPVLKEVNTIPPLAPVAKKDDIFTPSSMEKSATLELIQTAPELKNFTDVPANIAEIFTFYPRKSKKKPEIKKGHPVKGYLCQICDMTFPLTIDLDLHSVDTGHRNEKEFKCPHCDKKYYKSADLKYHQRTHKGKEIAICTICHKSFQNKGAFKMHCKSHSTNYPTCKICNLKFAAEKDLADHSEEHKKTTTERSPQKWKETLNKESPMVDEGQRMARSLKKHSVETFECSICGMAFVQALELESHCVASGHITEKTFECSQCPSKYYRKTDLKFHRGTHKSFKIFICSICSEPFSDNIAFQDHFKIHDGEYPSCEECGIKFGKIDNLKDHIFFNHQSNIKPEESHREDKINGATFAEVNKKLSKDSLIEPEKTRQVKKFNLTGSFSKGYLCQVCSTGFPHSAYLDFHNLETGHENEKAFSCSECSKKFYKKTDLKYHRRVHRPPVTYPCKICSVVFRSKITLRNHFKNHPGVPECASCAIKFATKAELEEHVKNHKDNMIKCDVCHEEFRWKISLKYHQKRFHVNKPKKLKKPKGNDFYCDFCMSAFDEEKDLEEHSLETRHTTEKKHKCSTCNDAFYRIKDLRSHEKVHIKNKTYTCEVCNRIFSKNHKLRDHMRVHTGDLYSCLFCPSTFVKKVSLERHLERHSGVVHVCEFCGKSFKDKGRYRNHRRLHTGECFVCDLCPKKCYTQGELNDHNNIHKGIKPHRCHICDKTFYTIMRLQKHKVTHRPKEAVSCLTCKKPFDSQKKLEYHMKLHTEESFQCTLCEKQYLSKQILADHIKFLHQGPKEFPCKICSKIFYSNTRVVQHQRNHLAEIRANRRNNNNCSNIPNKNYTNNNNSADVPNNNFSNIPSKSSKLSELFTTEPKNNYIPNGSPNGLKNNNISETTGHNSMECPKNNFSNGSITTKNKRSNDLNNPKCKRPRNSKVKKKLPFACHLCQDSFKRPEQLRKHIVEHDYPKPSFHTIVFKQD